MHPISLNTREYERRASVSVQLFDVEVVTDRGQVLHFSESLASDDSTLDLVAGEDRDEDWEQGVMGCVVTIRRNDG